MAVVVNNKPSRESAAQAAPAHGLQHNQGSAPPRRIDVSEVVFSRSWFALGGASAVLALAGTVQYGWPVAAGLALAGTLGLAYGKLFEPAHPVLERVELRLPNLPAGLDGLRIGQLSDMHLGYSYTAENLRWAVAQMQNEQPDMVAITGDLVHFGSEIARLPELLRGLAAPLGCYAVPGNHDYLEGVGAVRAALAQAGIPLLLNEHRNLNWRGTAFSLAGIDDLWKGEANIDAALAGIPAGQFTVMLAHEPDTAREIARRGVGLQLSGHTHGGHIRLPGLGHFSTPHYGVEYVIGHYQVGDMALYVSRGLGGMPLRFLCRPEATILTLRRA